jgi:2,3-bisphosphoglycerate-dependent phosphoglycerate mutase
MSNLILVRHGQSEWNLEKRFTGWVDVDLTEKGKLEANKAGELIKEQEINIDHFYSSIQIRAINTLKAILYVLKKQDISFEKAWQLNERHYGSLTGLNKEEMKEKLGETKIHEFRRSWNIKPDPLSKDNPYHPINIKSYKNVPLDNLPDTESLKDTYDRVIPYFKNQIQNKLVYEKNILIAAHGNSIRSLCKFLFKLDEKKISLLEIPTGNPLMITFNEKNKITKCNYLDEDRKKDLLISF